MAGFLHKNGLGLASADYAYWPFRFFSHCMAVASGPARPVLAGPVFTLALMIAHAQTITNRQ